ncbi:MAG: proprotein convertase P-domain-containing protein [Saprospiraceae bacterium]|nr:proprotein convertase P-domain-containing protein [Saprospiraceae bacterium]
MSAKLRKLFAPTVVFLLTTLVTQAQNYLMNGTPINDCDGFFIDSGGNSGPYSPNQNLTTTICPGGGGGTHIQLFFPNIQLGDGDVLCFYDGPNTAATQLTCSDDFLPGAPITVQATAVNPSGCLTVTFTSDGSSQDNGWNAEIHCIAACQNIQSQLVSTNPIVEPADTGWIDACPGQRVFLSAQGIYPQNGAVYNHSDFTSSFLWEFGDGSMAVGPTVSNIYDEPGGYVVQLTITDQFGCKNTNYINQRVRISTRPSFNVNTDHLQQICVGDSIQLNAVVDTILADYALSVMPTPSSFQAGGILSDSLPLPDGTGTNYETSIVITQFSPGQVLNDIEDLLSICITMEHSWMHDLDLFITCPDGTQVKLQDQEFIGNEVFLGEPYELDDFNTPNPPAPGIGWEYCFTPDAAQTWTQYSNSHPNIESLPEGEYASFESLDALLGCPLNGEWVLTVQDQWAQDNGWVFEWSVNFDPLIFPDLETFTPQIIDYSWQSHPSIYFMQPDSIGASPLNAGTASYTFMVMDDFGCTYDTTVNVNILPATHPNCYSCQEILTPVDDRLLCQNENTVLNVTGTAVTSSQVTFEASPFYPIGFSNHPPANPYRSTIAVNSISPLVLSNPVLQLLSVCIDIQTDWCSDLNISLRSPAGTVIDLSSGNGGSGDNYTNTCFTPSAATAITAGAAPFTGNFRPEGNWNLLSGTQINGNWQLVVTDAFGINQIGRLNSWTITFLSTNNITYTWTPSQGLSCNNCPAPTASPNVTRTYMVQATDSYGCTQRDTVTVGVVNDINAPVVSCESTADGEITFSWTQVDNFTDYEVNVTINGSSSGWQGPVSDLFFIVGNLVNDDNVSIEVRVNTGGASLNCVVESGTGTCVYSNCTLTSALTSTSPVSCNGGNNGTALVTAQSAEMPLTFFIDGSPIGQSSGSFSGLIAGNHAIAVVDGVGCSDTLLFNLAEPAVLSIPLQITQAISCHNGNNGLISAIPQGGNGGYNLSWSGPAIPNPNGIPAGTYAVTVTDNKGCTATNSIVLANPPQLSVMLLANAPNCFNTADGSMEAIATGGTGTITYTWSNGLPTQPIQSNLAAGNYCVTATDQNGCTATACSSISAPSQLVINSITPSPADCFGNNTGSAFVVASGGTPVPGGDYNFAWNDPIQQVSDTAVFLFAGNYSVTVTDDNGCQVTGQVAVPQPTQLVANMVAVDALCFGENSGNATVVPGGGVGPYTVIWDTGQTSTTINNLVSNAYHVTVTDANGCTAQGIANVGQPNTPVAVAVSQTFTGCFGANDNEASAMPSGGTGFGYTYTWSNGQTGPTAINLPPGTQSVNVTDSNGCSVSGQVNLSDWEDIDVNIIAIEPTCFGDANGQMGINVFSGGAGTANNAADYTFNWSNSGSGLTIQNLPGGITYSVTVSDQQGCSKVFSRALSQPQDITFEFTHTDVACNAGTNGNATVVNIQGSLVGGYTYQWSNNAGNQVTVTANNLAAGLYFVTVSDANGCNSDGQVQINQPTALSISMAAEDEPCFGNALGSVMATVNGGVPGYTYNWSGQQQTTAMITNLPAGVYTVTAQDANGCQISASAEVLQPEPITVSIATKPVDCFGMQNGSITIIPLGGTAPFQYSLNNSSYIGSGTLIGLEGGEYTIYIRDHNGCMLIEKATVASPPEFMVNAGVDTTITIGDLITLSASSVNGSGEVLYTWYEPYDSTLSCSECPDPQVLATNTITFELYGVDENGCEDNDFVNVFIRKPRVLVVPTGFTPNGDGANDRLLVHGKEGTIVRTFRLYDRWGELLYEARDFEVNDVNIGWDGSFAGKMMNGGVYLWYVDAEYADGVREVFKGQTTLIR